jgi:RNA-directed DNA polymerase
VDWKVRRSPVNTDAPSLSLVEAKGRVLGIQTKLHRWATADASRRFDDLFNLVTDPAFLLVAWERVRTNRGARTAGVDGATAYYIGEVRGEEEFLAQLRVDLKAGAFVALPVRERVIPKSGGKLRRLGIPTVTAKCRAPRQLFGSGADRPSVSCAGWSPRSGVVRQAAWP